MTSALRLAWAWSDSNTLSTRHRVYSPARLSNSGARPLSQIPSFLFASSPHRCWLGLLPPFPDIPHGHRAGSVRGPERIDRAGAAA